MSAEMSLIWGIVSCCIVIFLIIWGENSKLLEKIALAVLSNYRYLRCKKCGKSWNVSKHIKIEHGYICPECAKNNE